MLSDEGRVEVQYSGIDIHEDWRCPGTHNGARGREETECRGDDGVSRLYAGSDQRKPEGLRSRCAPHSSGSSGEGGDFALEHLHLGAKNERLRIAHARNGSEEVLANGLVLATQVEQGDGYGCGSQGGR